MPDKRQLLTMGLWPTADKHLTGSLPNGNIADKGGRGVFHMLTITDKGGREAGVSQLLTLSDKGERGGPDHPNMAAITCEQSLKGISMNLSLFDCILSATLLCRKVCMVENKPLFGSNCSA